MPDKDRISAQVFLKTVSGKSLRDLDIAAAPGDLKDYQPSPSGRENAKRILARLGFRVFEPEDGLTLSIEGRPALFAQVFDVAGEKLATASAESGVALPVPDELSPFVEHIVVVLPPEYFR